MSKFWFFERKGRPTAIESRICDKINSLINQQIIDKQDVDEYISNYGKAFTEDDLTGMLEYVSGEDLEGNKIQETEDYYEDEEDGIENAVEDVIDDTNREQVENPINFNPFEEPVVEM